MLHTKVKGCLPLWYWVPAADGGEPCWEHPAAEMLLSAGKDAGHITQTNKLWVWKISLIYTCVQLLKISLVLFSTVKTDTKRTAAEGGVTYNFLLVSVASHTDFMTLPCSPLEDLRYGPVCRRRVDHVTLSFQILWWLTRNSRFEQQTHKCLFGGEHSRASTGCAEVKSQVVHLIFINILISLLLILLLFSIRNKVLILGRITVILTTFPLTTSSAWR